MGRTVQENIDSMAHTFDAFWRPIEKCLTEVVPLWEKLAPNDLRIVVRRSTGGALSSGAELYKGIRTRVAFERQIEELASYKELSALWNSNRVRPRYLSIAGFTTRINVNTFIVHWFQYLVQLSSDNTVSLSNISRLRDEVRHLLISRSIDLSIFAAISGLDIVGDKGSIKVSESIVVRALTDEEWSDLHSYDPLSVQSGIPSQLNIKFIVQIDCKIPFLANSFEEARNWQKLYTQKSQMIDSVVTSLHLASEGSCAVAVTTYKISTPCFPIINARSRALVLNVFSKMDLAEHQFEAVCLSYDRLARSKNTAIQLAAKRLVDASARHSPVEALLDSAIGLENILNPQDNVELSFRVALNFALLFRENRRSNFDTLRGLYAKRSQIVHGGKAASTEKFLREASVQSITAVKCLRSAINAMLQDELISMQDSLSSDFWIERMFQSLSDE